MRRDLGPYAAEDREAQTWVMATTKPNSQDNLTASSRSPGATPTERSQGSHAGDLARRLSHRRNELGLSIEELAERAGVDPWFLAYFEQSADCTLSAGSLYRLAVALDTTPFALEGGDIARPPGAGRAGPHPALESLTPAQCEDHLAAGGVGRIVFSTDSGPVAFPVNFVFAGGCVIFRTSDAMVANISGAVAFEVDHVDEAMSEGWSVLVPRACPSDRGRRVASGCCGLRYRGMGRWRPPQRGQHRAL